MRLERPTLDGLSARAVVVAVDEARRGWLDEIEDELPRANVPGAPRP